MDASWTAKSSCGMWRNSVASAGSNSTAALPETDEADVLRWPIVGGFLKWRHSRTVLLIPLLPVAVVMMLQGLFGAPIAPNNRGTVLTWVHFRGALVLVLLAAGNFFCLACPFMLVRNFMRRWIHPRFTWPRR